MSKAGPQAKAPPPPQSPSLPEAYVPFQGVFESLSGAMATVLGGLLTQFEPLLASFDDRGPGEQGEFDGFAGLARRGDIDRLLHSELLLRTEAPVEFLRRLAENELLFHDRVMVDKRHRQVVRAMISIGPGILGHGRIVALAALFVLARMAGERGRDFHWCFLPRAEGVVWFDRISVNSIKRLLRSASYREAEADDVAAAIAAWQDLHGEGERPGTRHADWLIAADRGGWLGAGRAPQGAPLTACGLRFTLQPPRRGEPREAEVDLRNPARGSRRMALTFAPDRVCLAALEKPFPQPRAERAAGPAGAQIPPLEGWEPRYLWAPHLGFRLVRSSDGLLVFDPAKGRLDRGVWFVPLPKDVILAGAAIEQDRLALLLNDPRGGDPVFRYFSIPLVAGKAHAPSLLGSHAVPSAHLFRGRSPFAIPALSMEPGPEFYSTSGQGYRLDFDSDAAHSRFNALYRAPRTCLAVGPHRIVTLEKDGAVLLRVHKRDRALVQSFALADCYTVPKAFHAIAWSPWSKDIAYALRPRQWIIARPLHLAQLAENAAERQKEELAFEVEPCERVLFAGFASDGPWACIWSDARFGGEGCVDYLRLAGGKRARRQPTLKLGQHAERLAALVQTDDGFWGVALDAEGEPRLVIHYRQDKHTGIVREAVHDLAEVRARAVQIDIGAS